MDRPSLPPEPFLDKVLDLLVDTVCVVDAEGRFVFVSASAEQLLGYAADELVGRNMIELVHPDDRERTLRVAEEIMQGHPQAHFENRWLHKDGRPVDIMWSARWSTADGLRLAVARDVTPLKHAARMQSAVYRISEAAHEADDLPALLNAVQAIIGDLIPADTVLAAMFDARRGTVSFPYAAGEAAPEQAERPLREGTPLAQVLRSGQPLLTATGTAGAEEPDAGASGAARGNWLGAPLTGRDGVLGALVVETSRGPGHYTGEHLELLKFASTQVTTVVERKHDEERLRHLALHDPLTDLPNRALFHDRFAVALERALRDGERVGLLYLDVDDFKRVNDSHGHEAGDTVLRVLAGRLNGCVRRSDTVGRMGGDEFTILLTNLSGPDDCATVADKVRAAVTAPYAVGGRSLTVSVSMGSAVFPEDGRDQDALIRHADAGMYARKARQG